MSYDDDQLRTISEAVCEQLGIEEEDDYYDELDAIEHLNEKVKTLENAIKEKDHYIHKLEILLIDESKRIDLLEQMCHEVNKKLMR